MVNYNRMLILHSYEDI